VEHYLTRVGSGLADHAHRILPYRFHYIPDPNFMNAFALPGGHVYVGGGLLQLMDSEDELAAVMGHEIEHIDHYHCAERVQQEEALRRLPLGGLVALPVELFEAGYSKDQELEADREGTQLAVQAGYSANGAIRMFETFDRLHKEYQAKAKTPQEEAAQVAEQALEGYFRSHPLPAERIAQGQKMIASEGWAVRAERDLRVAYIFRTDRAAKALEARRYAQAEQLANESLRLRPDQPRAFQVLALAQFAQGNFAGAAQAYRKLLEIEPSNVGIIISYAHALAAADRSSAAAEFRRWAESLKGDKPPEAQEAAAGLELLNGNREPAHKLEAEFEVNGDVHAPVWISDLGWWHYQSGDYATAVQLLSEAVQQRPADAAMAQQLAWALIEVRHYGDALARLENVSYEAQVRPEKAIIRAVIYWQTQEHEQALGDFNTGMASRPEWKNSNWVKSLYSPLVLQSVQEMQAENERRRQKTRVSAGR
jgi:predicted Zn-dependent protease